MRNEAIKQAAEILGSQAELSRRLRIQAPTINQWISGIRPVPLLRCVEIEALTGRQVTRQQIRPDIPWAQLRETAA